MNDNPENRAWVLRLAVVVVVVFAANVYAALALLNHVGAMP